MVRKPVMVYTSQGIRNAHVKVWRMLEDQLGRKLSKVGQAAEEALDLLKYDGDVNDSLACDFCSGRWKALDAEKWQGNFVADLRQRPLQPVKVRWNRFCCLTYSPEMD